MPFEYPHSVKKMLTPCLKTKGNPLDVKEYGFQVQKDANHVVLDFLGQLAKKISGDFAYDYRRCALAGTYPRSAEYHPCNCHTG
jgi:hypothetical protein